MQYSTCIQIAGVEIVLNSDFPVKITKQYQDFLAESAGNGFQIRFCTVKTLDIPEGELISEEMGFDVLWNASLGCFRLYRDSMQNRKGYAIGYYDDKSREIRVSILEDEFMHAASLDTAFMHIGWEELMLRAGRLPAHACCMDTPYGGILFSGPSGIGKSTQGDLWSRYTDSHVVNGDRPILYQNNGSWVASGSPYAGSSQIYLNETVPVRAIVMLQQSASTTIRKMESREAIHAIWPGLAVSEWDPEIVTMALNLAEKISSDLPFYAMNCTPDRDAVEKLMQVFEEEKYAG